jgi:hypothetical protein
MEAVLTMAPPPWGQHLHDLVLHAHEHADQVDRQHHVDAGVFHLVQALVARLYRTVADPTVVA